MRNDELESVLKQLSEEEREEADYLLRLARARKIIKPLKIDIEKRSKEKNITFVEARRELISEAAKLQSEIISTTRTALKRKLSKGVRENLGIKGSGRPKGSPNKSIQESRDKFYNKLKEVIKNNYLSENETTMEDAAKALGLGRARQLRRKLREIYKDSRKWKELVQDLLAE